MGAKAATAIITDNANATATPGSTQTVTLSGTGTAPATTFDPTSIDFGDLRVDTTSAVSDVELTNSGTDTLNLTSIGLTGADVGEFALAPPTSGTDCTTISTLAAGASCSVGAQFAPTGLGVKSANITFTDDAPVPGSTQDVPLSGTGVAPEVTLDPTSLNFGGQNIGTQSPISDVLLTNSGTDTFNLTSIELTGANASDFALAVPTIGTDCRTLVQLAPAASCNIGARFAPATVSAKSASITIVDDAADSPQTVALSGTGTQPGLNLTSASVDFGNVQVGTVQQAVVPITLNNTGTGPLTITGIAIEGTNPADFSRMTNCPLSPNTLAAGADCTITPAMQPDNTGALAATISVSSDAPSSPDAIALAGTGVDFAITSATPSQTVTAGGTANYVLNFTTVAGDTVKPTLFECDDLSLPFGADCVFAPLSVPADSGDTQVGLAISTTARASSSIPGGRPSLPPTGLPAGWLALFAALVLSSILIAIRMQQQLTWPGAGRVAMLAVLLVFAGYLAGCASAGTGFPEGQQGTPPGTYTVTVEATSGAVQRFTTVTLVVQ